MKLAELKKIEEILKKYIEEKREVKAKFLQDMNDKYKVNAEQKDVDPKFRCSTDVRNFMSSTECSALVKMDDELLEAREVYKAFMNADW